MPKNDYWKSEPDTETSLRFAAHRRRFDIYGSLAAGVVFLLALAATALWWGAFERGASSVLAASAFLILAPTLCYLLVTRLSDSAFMRRILREDDR